MKALVDVTIYCKEGLTLGYSSVDRLPSIRTFVPGDEILVDEGIAFGLSGGQKVQTLVDAMAIYGEGLTFDHNSANRLRSLRTFVPGDEGSVDEEVAFGQGGG